MSPDVLSATALAHARRTMKSPLGSYVTTGEVQRTSSGIAVVHVQQQHAGIPVLDAVRSVRLDAAGKAVRLTGTEASIAASTPTLPRFRATEAANEAFLRVLADGHVPPHLGFNSAAPEVIASFGHAACPTALRKPPFVEPVIATLVIDPSGRKSRLLWEIRLGLPDGGGSYLAHVAATGSGKRPRVVGLRRTSSHAIHGDVYEFDPRADSTRATFPRPRESYPSFGSRRLPAAAWVSADATDGNNARAVSPSGAPVRAAVEGGDLVFRPATPGSTDHGTINAFYWCNVLHDFFHLLGFDEEAGNFQRVNVTGAGGQGDALSVIVRDHPLLGLAFFQNRPDGTAPTLELGALPGKHTALDADLVIHEFVHGVTSRIIGGKHVHTPLSKPQSLALGEGFSDYYAVSLQNWFRRKAGREEEWSYGAWLIGRPNGLRNHSYENHPNTYGFLKKAGMKPHHAGEVWCAALLELNRALALDGDRDQGDELGWQIVFDSLKLLHPGDHGPHFLHARDAVEDAFDALVADGTIPGDAALKRSVKDVFRKRGMGTDARSDDAGFSGVHEGFA